MNTTNKSGLSELDIDLDLHFLPAWAQRASHENEYAKYESGGPARERRDDRPPRRGPSRDRRHGPPGERGPQSDRKFRRDEGRPHFGRRNLRDDRRDEHREPAPPPVHLNVSLIPEAKGVEALARQIRLTGRAYPLFDIGFLILKKSDRYDVQLSVIKDAEGKVTQPLFVCALDESLWLSEQAAVDYVLDKHFSTFYQTEKISTDPPKGVYTFVAQCGMSGTILGPPNFHDYHAKLRKLHQERFSRIPFEAYKARVKIVKDEAVVKQWIEEQSFRFEYVCLNVPEAIRLNSREAVEKHFRETHLANVVKSVESHQLGGSALQAQPNHLIRNLARRAWEEQTRFPMKVVHALSQQFASHGLQFFKVNKNITHVTVARPHYLDLEATPVSENLRRIVEFIRDTPKCTRRKLLGALAPKTSAPTGPEQSLGNETAASAVVPGEGRSAATTGVPSAEAPAERAVSPEFAAINSDLHWLIHEGHVIEFANGILELAKKRVPLPSKVAPKPAEQPVIKVAPSEDSSKEDGSKSSQVQVEAVQSENPPPVSENSDPAPTESADTDDQNQAVSAPPASEDSAVPDVGPTTSSSDSRTDDPNRPSDAEEASDAKSEVAISAHTGTT